MKAFRFRHIQLARIAFLLLIAAVTPYAVPQITEVVAVAGLLGGATVVPLAQFREGKWIHTWPSAGEGSVRNIKSFAEIPAKWYPGATLPRTWYAWTETLHGVPIRVIKPETAPAHCGDVWGLATLVKRSGHETTALATNIGRGVTLFARGSADPQLANLARKEFLRREASEPDAQKRTGIHQSCEPRVNLYCAETGDEQYLCFFFASREYQSRSTEGSPECNDLFVVQGWLRQNNSSISLLSSSATQTDCEAVNLRTVTPHLLITIAGRMFVITQEHGYEDESFAVLELIGGKLSRVLEVPGTGC